MTDQNETHAGTVETNSPEGVSRRGMLLGIGATLGLS